MKYLIDLSCPTDVYLYKGLKAELEKRGHSVHLVTRGYMGDQMVKLAKHVGLDAVPIGCHGGKNRYSKLIAGATRIHLLANYVKNIMGLDDLKGVVSSANPETCRVGFGLGVNVYTWNDSPDLQVAQSRLTTPISDWIFTPWLVPNDFFTVIGYDLPHVFQYDTLFPMAWLPDIKTNPNILADFNYDLDNPLVFFRESETQSAYLGKRDLAIEAVKALAEKHPDWQFATRIRYSRKAFEDKMKHIPYNVDVFNQAIDLHSFLAKSSLFISGGGTMTIEAVYYGTPTISTREKTTFYEKYLIDRNVLKRGETVEEVVTFAEDMIVKRVKLKDFDTMHYPLKEIADILEE